MKFIQEEQQCWRKMLKYRISAVYWQCWTYGKSEFWEYLWDISWLSLSIHTGQLCSCRKIFMTDWPVKSRGQAVFCTDWTQWGKLCQFKSIYLGENVFISWGSFKVSTALVSRQCNDVVQAALEGTQTKDELENWTWSEAQHSVFLCECGICVDTLT